MLCQRRGKVENGEADLPNNVRVGHEVSSTHFIVGESILIQSHTPLRAYASEEAKSVCWRHSASPACVCSHDVPEKGKKTAAAEGKCLLFLLLISLPSSPAE